MSRQLQREGIWNTIISYAGISIGYVNVLILFPNILNEEQVGLTRLLLTIAEMFAQFAALGFVNMSVRYFPYFRNKEKQHHGFLFVLLSVPMFGFALITVLFLLFKPAVANYYSENSELLLDYYYYIIPLAFFTLLFNLFTAYLRSLFKTIVSSFVKDFLSRLLILVLLIVYTFGWMDFRMFVILYVAANSAIALVLIAYTLWLKQLHIKPSFAVAASIVPIKEMLYFGLFTFMGNISVTIIKSVDQVMISAVSLADNGIYTTSFYITSAIVTPALAIFKIAFPQVAEFWKDKNMPGLAKFYKQITLINLIIGLLLFIGIWANLDNLFSFMPETYSAGKYVVLFLAIARLVDLATGINGIILATSDKYRWDLLFNIVLAALTIWTNSIFIPLYGMNGAAFATMLSLIFINLLRMFFVLWAYKMQPFAWSSLGITIIALIALGVSYLIPYLGNVYLDIAVRSVAITIVYGSLALGFNVYPEMNVWVRKIVKTYTGI
ncbi:oligosaccharide flippase family protein [Pontibacter sp. KCTC 32443]|uniref:lipopolysaccharide biosynthesis protein n=1 Tax=Pontibacter TaxID=323449 RepID=UPI00164D7760|nr:MULTISPECIES: oligosaccharide flippase family protein [Pontibacter]MBC5773615.1 oligosaccharide flippase family protein [Pontibacter sp. KCTC 32443]